MYCMIDSGCTHTIVDEHTWAALKENAIKCVNPIGKQLYTVVVFVTFGF